jgi:hypothetical protein
MSAIKLWRNLTNSLHNSASLDYRFALCVAALTALLSALRVSFDLGYNYGVFKSLEGNHSTCCVYFLGKFLIPITIGFAVVVIGLWLRRSTGFFLSMLALLWVGGFYVLWHLGTLSLLPRMEVRDFSQLPNQGQHLFVLIDATWWDLAVLAIMVVLFVWHLKTLLMVNRNVQ